MGGAAVKGAAVGLVVAVLARGWMRAVAPDPEFTWDGSIAIAVVFVLFGACTGLVGAALARGRSVWWRLLAVPTLGAFLAQGIVVLPLAALSASLFGQRGPVWLRWALAAAGVAVTLAIVDDQGTSGWWLTSAGMLALGLVGGLGWGRVVRLPADRGTQQGPVGQ